MQIRLGNTFMWFLPTGLIHLTDENPGPIEVDYDSLSKEDQTIVTVGIRTGAIIGDIPQVIIQPKEEQFIPIKVIEETDPFDKVKDKLRIILNKKIPNIKKDIGLIDNPRELKFMFDIEKNDKARNKILNLINDKLQSVIAQIQASITEDAIVTELSPEEVIEKEIIESEEEVRTVDLNEIG